MNPRAARGVGSRAAILIVEECLNERWASTLYFPIRGRGGSVLDLASAARPQKTVSTRVRGPSGSSSFQPDTWPESR